MDMMHKIAAGTPVRRSRGHRRFFNDTTRAVQPYDVGKLLINGYKGTEGDRSAEAAASGVNIRALGEDFIAKNPDLSFKYVRGLGAGRTGDVNVIGKAPWWSDVGSRIGSYTRERTPARDEFAWARPAVRTSGTTTSVAAGTSVKPVNNVSTAKPSEVNPPS